MNKIFFDNLKKKAKESMETSGSHEFSHVERVYKLAVKIAKNEKADIDIVKAAALLHDIARIMEDSGKIKCHAEEGAKTAGKILEKTDFPKEKIKGVCEAIRLHRFSRGLKAETKEAMIIQDADRLDAIGAIAIARVFAHGGKMNRPIHLDTAKPKKYYDGSESESSFVHFHEKILKINPELFNTKTGRKIAEHRYNFVKIFIKEFLDEWNAAGGAK
jgi:uncharacterized protein